jgi:hypothetical protein
MGKKEVAQFYDQWRCWNPYPARPQHTPVPLREQQHSKSKVTEEWMILKHLLVRPDENCSFANVKSVMYIHMYSDPLLPTVLFFWICLRMK